MPTTPANAAAPGSRIRAALKRTATAQTQVEVSFQHIGLEKRFLPEVETTTYRIVQEALTNVARHAGVKLAAVSIQCMRGTLEVSVVDQGTGFDSNALSSPNESAGLSGMRERAGLLGGELTIETASGQGTRLLCVLPLKSERKALKKNGNTTFVVPIDNQPVHRRTTKAIRFRAIR